MDLHLYFNFSPFNRNALHRIPRNPIHSKQTGPKKTMLQPFRTRITIIQFSSTGSLIMTFLLYKFKILNKNYKTITRMPHFKRGVSASVPPSKTFMPCQQPSFFSPKTQPQNPLFLYFSQFPIHLSFYLC